MHTACLPIESPCVWSNCNALIKFPVETALILHDVIASSIGIFGRSTSSDARMFVDSKTRLFNLRMSWPNVELHWQLVGTRAWFASGAAHLACILPAENDNDPSNWQDLKFETRDYAIQSVYIIFLHQIKTCCLGCWTRWINWSFLLRTLRAVISLDQCHHDQLDMGFPFFHVH